YRPAGLASHPRRPRTPHLATRAGGVVGIAAIFSDSLITLSGMPLTACLVTMSVVGALGMAITSRAALFKLRRSEPK
ncbi:ethanolamine permease, partial [Klebsiella pneumoniae]|nr:ethanolamine permease [Klebsiella pneumoniae]